MKEFFKQFASVFGAGIAAACCLGLPVVLTAVGAVGLGFIVHDAYLFPLFVGFVGLSLWLLYRSAKAHQNMRPFWLSTSGGVVGAAALWLLVTGFYPLPWLIYASLAVLISGSVWDFINGRRTAACATEDVCETMPPVNMGRRATTGAALSVSAAAVFYGLYKSVDVFIDEAKTGEIACWGINACKGKTACSTAYNSCTGQNKCRGRGYIYVPEKECYARGGVLLKDSEANPKKG
jgi:MerC mercury resistance protein